MHTSRTISLVTVSCMLPFVTMSQVNVADAAEIDSEVSELAWNPSVAWLFPSFVLEDFAVDQAHQNPFAPDPHEVFLPDFNNFQLTIFGQFDTSKCYEVKITRNGPAEWCGSANNSGSDEAIVSADGTELFVDIAPQSQANFAAASDWELKVTERQGIGCTGGKVTQTMTSLSIAGCNVECPAGTDAECHDGDPCTVDTCRLADLLCVNLPDPDICDDGIDCTIDSCDSVTGCSSIPDDSLCPDDGLYCNGQEVCGTNGCESTGDPCAIQNLVCDEVNDECIAPIHLDIKPGSCPNPFNRSSHGVLPAALLGTADFDATMIDFSSARLARADGVGGSVAPNEGPPGPHSVFEDVATPFEGEPCDCHDLAADGIVDLLMKFKTDDVVGALMLDDLPAGALVELVVSGYLLDGTRFEGNDCVRLVPPGTLPGLLAVESSVAGAWIGVSPPDETLDGGGFADFERTFPLTTVVTLTAEEWAQGRPLRGWQIGGLLHHMGETTIEFAIDQDMTVRAVYGPTPSSGSPKPDPTAPESFLQEESASGAGTIDRR